MARNGASFMSNKLNTLKKSIYSSYYTDYKCQIIHKMCRTWKQKITIILFYTSLLLKSIVHHAMYRNTHAMLKLSSYLSAEDMLIFTNTSPTPSLSPPTLPSITLFFFSLFRSVNDRTDRWHCVYSDHFLTSSSWLGSVFANLRGFGLLSTLTTSRGWPFPHPPNQTLFPRTCKMWQRYFFTVIGLTCSF